jgi:2'-5' RNA ligase
VIETARNEGNAAGLARLFVAVLLPDDVRRGLAAGLSNVKTGSDGVAWVPEENLHVTIQFLGAVDTGRLPEIESCLTEAARGASAFTARTGPPGAFPDLSRPRVLFANMAVGGTELSGLADRVGGFLGPIGLARDERPFHPHVTLGRVTDPRRGGDAAYRFLAAALSWHSFSVSSIALVSSVREKAEPRYTVFREVPLGI